MIPIEKVIVERTFDDVITDNIYLIRVFGIVVYRRVYHNDIIAQRQRTSGFEVMPDMRQEIEEDF